MKIQDPSFIKSRSSPPPFIVPGEEFWFVDLFCGGGGSGNGIINAILELGMKPRGVFVNHWDKAINIHSVNHPDHTHLCTGVDNVDPNSVIPADKRLRLLWASPECTHHSVARGGKPMSEQSRATAWCVIRWIRKKRPDYIIVENVKEFMEWGPLVQKRTKCGKLVWMTEDVSKKRRAGKKRLKEVTEIPFRQERGEHRQSWLKRLSEAGFEMALRADPKRKGEKFEAWKREIRKLGYELRADIKCSAHFGDPTFRRRAFICCVRIDSGHRVFYPDATHGKPSSDGHVADGLLKWRTAREILDLENWGRSIFNRPKPLAAKTLKRIAIGLKKFGLKDIESRIRGYASPDGAGVFVIQQQRGGRPFVAGDEPMTPITTSGADCVVTPRLTPLILPQDSDGNRTRSIDDPAPVVRTESRGIGIVSGALNPCIVQNNGLSTAQSLDSPVGALLGGVKHHVMTPFLVKLRHHSHCSSVDLPVDVVSASGFHHALATAIMTAVQRNSETTVREVSAEETGRSVPLGEFIVGTAHSGVDEPVKAVCGNRGDAAIIKPWLYSYYSEGPPGADIDNPVPTSTGRARFGLCYPVVEIQGNLFILDIYFRMFELRELARANGFPDHYKFPGTKTDGVKAVGNSVTCGMSRALALALIQQDSKVTPYMLEINPSAMRECKNN